MLYVTKGKETYSMETKNICGKIPIELHEKVRQELEGTDMTIPQFLTTVITEHFESKGVEKMAARTLAVQVSEELFIRFNERYEKEKQQRSGRFSKKEFLIEIITQALDAADARELEEQEEGTPTEEEMDSISGEATNPEQESEETETEDADEITEEAEDELPSESIMEEHGMEEEESDEEEPEELQTA